MESIHKVVIASHNQGKVREIRDLLTPFGVETISAADLNLPEPEETEDSFCRQCQIKSCGGCACQWSAGSLR